MRKSLPISVMAATIFCVPGNATPDSPKHVSFESSEVPWRPSPNESIAGEKIAVLYGRPTQEGVFVIRLVLPKGWKREPHTHPQPEIITVLSGSLVIGHGTTAGEGKVVRIGAGGFSALPADTVHYAYVDEETVVQISTTGPWSVNYIKPAADHSHRARASN